MELLDYVLMVVCVVMAHLASVEGTNNSDIIGIAVAGCVGFVLLSVVISIFIVSCYWTSFFNKWMSRKGKVRMPREYFKKKEEAKRRLISNSIKPKLPDANGSIHPPTASRDATGKNLSKKSTTHNNALIGNNVPTANGIHTPIHKQVSRNPNSTPSVRAWHIGNPTFTNRTYEEQDATITLGEEADGEFRIVAEVVDNETLDVGPFKHDHSKEVPIKGDVYSEPYIYSTVEKSTQNGQIKTSDSVKPAKITGDSAHTSAKNDPDPDPDYATPGEVKITNFDQSLLYL